MTNYWRQFVALVTGSKRKLRDDPFFRARLRLAMLYATIATLFVVVIYASAAFMLFRKITTDFAEVHIVAEERAIELREIEEYLVFSVSIRTVIFYVLAFGASYFVAGSTLADINNIMQRHRRFISDASHELRTPLSIMKTNAEVALLSGPQMTGAEAVEVIQSNLEEVDRMAGILQHLIYSMRAGSSDGPKETLFYRLNLCDVAAKSVETAQKLAARKGISMTINITEAAYMMGSPIALDEMILNLLKNAINHTPGGGIISLSVINNHHGVIELIVKDTGEGIAPNDLPHIFDPFYKADEARAHVSGGSSGLGLTTVREIAQQHLGSISVESTLGKGTVMSIRFPAVGRAADASKLS